MEATMAERRNTQGGLIDGLTADLGGPRTGALLDRLDAAIPWSRPVRPIAALPEYPPKAPGEDRGGRPASPALTMLRCALLAKWFGLSDPQLEECLKDRLSFRRFAGLSLTDATPDETTFVVFRKRLREAGLDRRLFEITRRHPDERGPLEHPFAWMKRMGHRRVRCRGRRRNELDLALMLVADNLKRSLSLKPT
jgi:IS5 family transposase